MAEMDMVTGIKNFCCIKLKTLLACANMGFYKVMITETNFGLI